METAGRGAITSPSSKSAVVSMSPVYPVGGCGPPIVPDAWHAGAGCGHPMSGITRPLPAAVACVAVYADGVLFLLGAVRERRRGLASARLSITSGGAQR